LNALDSMPIEQSTQIEGAEPGLSLDSHQHSVGHNIAYGSGFTLGCKTQESQPHSRPEVPITDPFQLDG